MSPDQEKNPIIEQAIQWLQSNHPNTRGAATLSAPLAHYDNVNDHLVVTVPSLTAGDNPRVEPLDMRSSIDLHDMRRHIADITTSEPAYSLSKGRIKGTVNAVFFIPFEKIDPQKLHHSLAEKRALAEAAIAPQRTIAPKSTMQDRNGKKRVVIGYERGNLNDPHSNIVRGIRKVFEDQMARMHDENGLLAVAGSHNTSIPVRDLEAAVQAKRKLEIALTAPRGENAQPILHPDDFIIELTKTPKGKDEAAPSQYNVSVVMFEPLLGSKDPVSHSAVAEYFKQNQPTRGGWTKTKIPIKEKAMLAVLNQALEGIIVHGKADLGRRMNEKERAAQPPHAHPGPPSPPPMPPDPKDAKKWLDEYGFATAGSEPNALDDTRLPAGTFHGRLHDGIAVPQQDAKRIMRILTKAVQDSYLVHNNNFSFIVDQVNIQHSSTAVKPDKSKPRKHQLKEYEEQARESRALIKLKAGNGVDDFNLNNVSMDAARVHAAEPGARGTHTRHAAGRNGVAAGHMDPVVTSRSS